MGYQVLQKIVAEVNKPDDQLSPNLGGQVLQPEKLLNHVVADCADTLDVWARVEIGKEFFIIDSVSPGK